MPHRTALETAVSLATRERDAAAQRLAVARQGWIAAQLQLDQLETYGGETEARWAVQALNCTPEIMGHHYQFMERLSHAIGLQKGVVAKQAGMVATLADRLRLADTRRQSLLQVHDKRLEEQRRALERREQKSSDEQAALQYQRLAAGMMGGA